MAEQKEKVTTESLIKKVNKLLAGYSPNEKFVFRKAVEMGKLFGIQEGKQEFEGDLLRKDNHILGCMLECYCNVLEYRGFNKEARQIEEIASKLK